MRHSSIRARYLDRSAARSSESQRADDEMHDAEDRDHDCHPDESPEHVLLAFFLRLFIVRVGKEFDDAVDHHDERYAEHEQDERIENYRADLGHQGRHARRGRCRISKSDVRGEEPCNERHHAIELVDRRKSDGSALADTDGSAQESDESPDRNDDKEADESVDHVRLGLCAFLFVLDRDILDDSPDEVHDSERNTDRDQEIQDRLDNAENAEQLSAILGEYCDRSKKCDCSNDYFFHMI